MFSVVNAMNSLHLDITFCRTNIYYIEWICCHFINVWKWYFFRKRTGIHNEVYHQSVAEIFALVYVYTDCFQSLPTRAGTIFGFRIQHHIYPQNHLITITLPLDSLGCHDKRIKRNCIRCFEVWYGLFCFKIKKRTRLTVHLVLYSVCSSKYLDPI